MTTPILPAGFGLNADYSVRARVGDGPWQDVAVAAVRVVREFHSNPQGHDNHDVPLASFAAIDADEPVEIEVRTRYTDARAVTVRPASAGIAADISDGVARLVVDRPRKLVLAVNGDRARELHLFINPPETDIPDKAEPNVTWFAPGIHELEPFEYRARSGETIYLAAGAVVRGAFLCDHVDGVTIRGRGIIDHVARFTPGGRKNAAGIRLLHSTNVVIEGITLLNPVHYHIMIGQCRGVRISNTKSFSVSQWADGIDSMSTIDLQIRDVFIRSSDDCLAIYNSRWDFRGDSRDVRVENAVLWADVAHPIFLGCHGQPHGQDVLENVRFTDIDILEHHETNAHYHGCMAINAGDDVLVRGVTFEDIRVEAFTLGQLINLRVFFNRDYNATPGRGIHDVTFRNVHHVGPLGGPSVIEGYAADRAVEHVVFENVTDNGRPLEGGGHLRIGAHVRDVQFRGK